MSIPALLRLTLACVFASWSGSLAASDLLVSCADPSLSVRSASLNDADLACRHAIKAKEQITSCGLRQTTPLRIDLVEHLDHAFGDCLASFDCTGDVISVTAPGAIAGKLSGENAYRALPGEVVFEALIAHEMAHALLEQSSVGTDIAFVDHEYVAAAMELEAIGPVWREELIAVAPVSLPPKTGLISALIYGFDPRKFATNAWQFFDADPEGCDRILRISTGDFTFATLPR